MSITGKATPGVSVKGKINPITTINGYSAYEIAVMNGFEGDETKWLESLKGYTPKKGVDYFTQEDKAELINEIKAALTENS